MDATTLGAWVATGLTLFILSFLYKDNPLFKLAEHLYVGVSVGYTIVKAYDTVLVHLILKPIFEQGEVTLLIPTSSLNVIIILIGVSSVLFYFFFSVEHTGPGRAVARTGILFLMIAFGAAFGYTVMARMSLLIGRLTDLIEFSDPSYGRPTIWLLLLTVGSLIYLNRRTQGTPPDAQ